VGQVSRQRDKGTAAEVGVLGEYLKRWPHAYRPAPAGRHDHGDIIVPGLPLCTEVKSYLDLGRAISEGLSEAEAEARFGELPLAVARRRMKAPARWYAVSNLGDLLELVQLAEIARKMLGPDAIGAWFRSQEEQDGRYAG
jgi:hypothetical protein